ncbi:MAG: methyltransferase [Verrucomicrobia bacterium]|jgi:23S rRNA G2445 N2-methylase RlmL|nr:methyltransferase [Verrucomicrobiota bacterium]
MAASPEPIHEFFAAAIPGTERALCDELRELGFASVRLNRGGVPFRGAWREGWRACLESRIAQRIQLLVARFPAPTQDALYTGIKAIDWSPYITHRQTLSVNAVCRSNQINHSGFAALKVKDAIVDQVREQTQQRPSVDREDADVRIFMHLANDKAAVYLDVSGGALHRRGYRTETGDAPLRETLAAAILRLSGWDRKSLLVDPMCGSGTIAIEAAMWSANIAPGLTRERFGFERWANFDEEKAEALRILRGELRRAASGTSARIVASDIDPEVLGAAKANARAAGVRLTFKQRDVLNLQGDGQKGLVVTNPPYGVRLEKAPNFCQRVGGVFSRMHGWRVCILAGSPDYLRDISAKPKYAVPLTNGDLKCEFLTYDMK